MNNFKNEKPHVEKFTPLGKMNNPFFSTFFGKIPESGKDDAPEKLYSGGSAIGFGANLSGKKEPVSSNYGSSLLETVEKLQGLPKEQLDTPEMQKVVKELLDATNSILGSMHERKDGIPALLAQIDAKLNSQQAIKSEI
jgi:hypothetical protein